MANIREREPVKDPLPKYRHPDTDAFIDLNRPGSGSSRNRGKSSGKKGDSHSRRKGRGEPSIDDDDDDRVPSMTAKLADLILWLIEKQPGSRGNWTQISEHPFWGKKNINDAPSNLPSENAYYNLVRKMIDKDEREQAESLMREFFLTRSQAEEILKRSASGQLAAERGLTQALHATPLGKPERPHMSESTPIRPPEKDTLPGQMVGASRRVEPIVEDSPPQPLPERPPTRGRDDVVSESKLNTPLAGNKMTSEGTPAPRPPSREAKGTPNGTDLSFFGTGDGAIPNAAAGTRADADRPQAPLVWTTIAPQQTD